MNIYIENVIYHLTLPFRNLTLQAKLLQITRLITSLVVIILAILLLLGSLANKSAYVVRLDCSHLEVSTGLYNALRSSVSSTSNSIIGDSSDDDGNGGVSDNIIDHSLTASQIDILTQYAEDQVASAPQYIISGVWNWCYGNFEVKQVEENGVERSKNYNQILTCSKANMHYSFDYRTELIDIGLDSILNYAYDGNYWDSAYASKVEHRRKRFKFIAPSLIFSGATQVAIIIIGYVMYSNRGPAKDLSQTPRFLSHIQGVLSSMSFVSLAVGVGLMTGVIIQIRSEISNELSDFGIFLHLGSCWFAMSWIAVFLAFCCTCAWAGPVWCATPDDDLDEDEGDKVLIRNVHRNDSLKKVQDHFQFHRENDDGDRTMCDSGILMNDHEQLDHLNIVNEYYDDDEEERDTGSQENADLLSHDKVTRNHSKKYQRNHSFVEQTYDGYNQHRYYNPNINFLSLENDSTDLLNQGTSTRPKSFLTEEEVNLLDKDNYVNIFKK